MATRKQRSRRAKTFRHDYGFVKYDEDGNEIEVDRSEIRPKKDTPVKAKASGATKEKGKGQGRRPTRDPQPPSWRRALRRAAIWGGPVVVASILILRGEPVLIRAGFGVGYAVLFIPLTYWMDGVIYRRFEKGKDAAPSSRARRSR